MYRKAAVIAVSAVAVVGVGTAVAVAASGSSSTGGLPGTAPTSGSSASPSASGKAGKNGKAARNGKHKNEDGHGLLKRLEYGSVVVAGKDGKPVTVTLIRGTVTSVSASSISVQAADKTSKTYAITSGTVVRAHSAATHGKTTIDKVVTGDHVLVAGTGTTALSATQVVDTGK